MLNGLIDNLFGSASSSEQEEVPPDPARDREMLLEILFGRAAPSANKVVGFLGTSRGQQALGVVTVAAGAVLLPKVTVLLPKGRKS